MRAIVQAGSALDGSIWLDAMLRTDMWIGSGSAVHPRVPDTPDNSDPLPQAFIEVALTSDIMLLLPHTQLSRCLLIFEHWTVGSILLS